MARVVRIAFATEEDRGLDSIISSRFGRARYFIIVEYDLDTGSIKGINSIEGPGTLMRGGAGVKTVQTLVNNNVEIAVAGAFGPNALAALERMNIKHVELSGSKISEALDRVIRLAGFK